MTATCNLSPSEAVFFGVIRRSRAEPPGLARFRAARAGRERAVLRFTVKPLRAPLLAVVAGNARLGAGAERSAVAARKAALRHVLPQNLRAHYGPALVARRLAPSMGLPHCSHRGGAIFALTASRSALRRASFLRLCLRRCSALQASHVRHTHGLCLGQHPTRRIPFRPAEKRKGWSEALSSP
jgi:hypothetical protein